MNKEKTILLVEDCENDIELMFRAFEKAYFKNPIKTVRNGEEAIAYFNGSGIYSDRNKYPLPIIVLLDLNMPKMDGFGFLKWLRSQSFFTRTYIIVLTASMRNGDIEQAFDLGIKSFLIKPSKFEDLINLLKCLMNWLDYNSFARQNDNQ